MSPVLNFGDVILIFEFSDKLKEIDENKKSEKLTVAYLSVSQSKKYCKNAGLCFGYYEKYLDGKQNLRSEVNVNEDCFFGAIRIIEPEADNNDQSILGFCIKKNLIILTEINGRNQKNFERFLEAVHRFSPSEYSVELFIFAFIDSIIRNDNTELEKIEIDINRIEDKIINETEYKNFNEELIRYKRKLLNLRNYYKQLINIGEVFIENENEVFNKENLKFFRNFTGKAERLCSEVTLLRDSLVQLRETYQSHLDLKLNNTMKLFTIITAFFAPLTLIAGWYGMNFEYMPELTWKYGYLYVILLSVCSVIGCVIIFRHKKMM